MTPSLTIARSLFTHDAPIRLQQLPTNHKSIFATNFTTMAPIQPPRSQKSTSLRLKINVCTSEAASSKATKAAPKPSKTPSPRLTVKLRNLQQPPPLPINPGDRSSRATIPGSTNEASPQSNSEEEAFSGHETVSEDETLSATSSPSPKKVFEEDQAYEAAWILVNMRHSDAKERKTGSVSKALK